MAIKTAFKRKVCTRDFKLQVIRGIEAGKSQAAAAREHQITANTVFKWLGQYRKYEDRAFAGNGNSYIDEVRIAELERMAGQRAMENYFLKKSCRRSKSGPGEGAGLEAEDVRAFCLV